MARLPQSSTSVFFLIERKATTNGIGRVVVF
jgi:hypothetical protein